MWGQQIQTYAHPDNQQEKHNDNTSNAKQYNPIVNDWI